MSQEKFNPYFKPDLISSIKQQRQREAERNQRLALTNDKYRDAMEAAERLGIPVSFKQFGGDTIVFHRGIAVNPIDSQPESQEPTGQK